MSSGFKSFLIGAATAATLALSPMPVAADMQAHIGPLKDVIELGQDGEWTLEDKGGWFIMTNTDAPGAIRYYWMELPESRGPDYVASVNLVAQTDVEGNPSFAGMIFNYRASDRYMGVAIGTDGGGYIFIRTPDGFKTNRAENVQARNDGSDMLRAHVTANKVRFELNGDTLFSIESPDGFSSKLGVLAIGQGQFGFTGLTVY